MRKAIAKAVARQAVDDGFDAVAIWSAALWLLALLYLLATFDPVL